MSGDSGNPYRKKSRVHYNQERAAGSGSPARPVPENPPLGVEGHQERKVTCTCGWSGTIKQLQNTERDGGVLNMGPGFQVCPSCRSENGLQA